MGASRLLGWILQGEDRQGKLAEGKESMVPAVAC